MSYGAAEFALEVSVENKKLRTANSDLRAINGDLLEALKLITSYAVHQYEEGNEHHPTLPSAIGVARAAIKKAGS